LKGKAKDKRQKAKGKSGAAGAGFERDDARWEIAAQAGTARLSTPGAVRHFCLLPFAFCLLP